MIAEVNDFVRAVARHYPRIFVEAASRTSDARLKTLAALAFVYSIVRFVEAYGLWHIRGWAEWFAIIAGSLFLPVEVYEMFRRATWMSSARRTGMFFGSEVPR